MITHGRDLILTINGYPIGLAKSCDLDLGTDFITSCSPVSGMFKNKIPCGKNWSVSCNGLVELNTATTTRQDTDNLMTFWKSNTKLHLCFYDTNDAVHVCGECYISSLKTSGSVGALATYSVSLEGSGELKTLTKSTLEAFNYYGVHCFVYSTNYVPTGTTLSGAYYVTSTGASSGQYIYGLEFTSTKVNCVHVIGNKHCQLYSGSIDGDIEDVTSHGSTYDDTYNQAVKDRIMKLSSSTNVWFKQPAGTYTLLLDSPADVYIEEID